MMQNNIKIKQVGTATTAAAVLFTTPFAANSGTAGYTTLNQFSSTGNSVFATTELKTAAQLYSENLSTIMEEYGLDQQQLAKLMSVSRQALNNWLDGKVERIRSGHQERFEQLEQLLSSNISPDLRRSFGKFLKRKLDEDSAKSLSVLTQQIIDEETAQLALIASNQRLIGLKKADRLDKLLGKDRPAFI